MAPVAPIQFSANGTVVTDFAGGVDEAVSIVIQADGAIIVGGIAEIITEYVSGSYAIPHFTVARYSSDGSLDSSFGVGGVASSRGFPGETGTLYPWSSMNPFGGYVVLTPDGRITIGGHTQGTMGNEFLLIGFNDSGQLDTTFGLDGTALVARSPSSPGIFSSLKLLDNGHYLVAGTLHNRNFQYGDRKYPAEILVATDGSVIQEQIYIPNNDSGQTIADGAIISATPGLPSGFHLPEWAKDYAIASDGKIVVVGSQFNGSDNDFLVARYNADGVLDSTFGHIFYRREAAGSADWHEVTRWYAPAVGTGGASITISQSDGTFLKIIGDGLTINGNGHATGGIVNRLERLGTDGSTMVEYIGGLGVSLQQVEEHASAGTLIASALYSSNTVRGSTGDDFLASSRGNDRYSGEDGSDTVDYSTDWMFGGAAGITINLGSDLSVLRSGEAYDGFGDIDTLVSVENVIGTPFSDVIVGSRASNRLEGFDGDDLLYGDSGTDILIGGSGSDRYFVDSALDLVFEAEHSGEADAVLTSVTYSLLSDAEVEWLRALNYAGLDDLRLTGSNTSNKITGNAGDNTIDGKGGIDYLYGLGGNDTYIVDNVRDQVYETVGNGIDRVLTNVSYGLRSNAEVEWLRALNYAGLDNLRLTGSNTSNKITGNAGDNTIDGKGGIDYLYGLGGNDTYIVDNVRDQVYETVGNGIDRVLTNVSYGLRSNAEVETVQLLSSTGATAANLTGNEFGNKLIGNNGNNVLRGKLGADVLTGLGGSDTFVFETALGQANIDRIVDFQAGEDRIVLDDAVFSGISRGALSSNAFHIGARAGDIADRIIYDRGSGVLLYDADGTAGGAIPQIFAVIGRGLSLDSGDFIVV